MKLFITIALCALLSVLGEAAIAVVSIIFSVQPTYHELTVSTSRTASCT